MKECPRYLNLPSVNLPQRTAIAALITDFGSRQFSVTGSLFPVFAADELTTLFAVECNSLNHLIFSREVCLSSHGYGRDHIADFAASRTQFHYQNSFL